jgi:hypothetical protein
LNVSLFSYSEFLSAYTLKQGLEFEYCVLIYHMTRKVSDVEEAVSLPLEEDRTPPVEWNSADILDQVRESLLTSPSSNTNTNSDILSSTRLSSSEGRNKSFGPSESDSGPFHNDKSQILQHSDPVQSSASSEDQPSFVDLTLDNEEKEQDSEVSIEEVIPVVPEKNEPVSIAKDPKPLEAVQTVTKKDL